MKLQFITAITAITAMSMLVACGTAPSSSSETNTATPAISSPVEPSAVYEDGELARAVTRGIGDYQLEDTIASGKQLAAMLSKVVELNAPDKVPLLQGSLAPIADSTTDTTRFEAMLAVLLTAEVLGGDFLHYSADWDSLHRKIGEPWDSFPPSELSSNYNGKQITIDDNDWNYDATAYFYAMGRSSTYSGKPIFGYDADSNTMRPADPLTYTEALQAAVRLHDSVVGNVVSRVTMRTPTPEDDALLAKVEARKAVIKNSPTTVTVTGTTYYLSNSGNDENDGKSPQTAWATLDRVNNDELQPGDGVLLERGGLWRGKIQCAPGVTYSAYGEGDKPKLYGSPENGTGGNKWTLWKEQDGRKIWKFYHDIPDCGNIVFDDGASYASRVFSFWDGSQAVQVNDLTTPFVIERDLSSNLQFYSTFDSMASIRRRSG